MKKIILFAVMVLVSVMAMSKEKKRPSMETENMNKAIKAYNADMKDSALVYLNDEMLDNPRNGYAMMYMAFCLDTMKSDDRIALLMLATDYIPKKDLPVISYVYDYVGRIYMSENDIENSLKYFEKAYKLYRKNFEALDNLSCCYMIKEDYKMAAKYVDKMLKLDPTSLRGYYLNAYLNYYDKEYDKVMELCDVILGVNPNIERFRALRALVLEAQGKHEEAINENFAVYEMNNDNQNAMARLVNYLYDDEMGLYTLAKFRVFNVKYPNDTFVIYILGLFYENQGNYDRAIEYYQSVLDIDGMMDPTTLECITRCYFDKGEYENVIRMTDVTLDLYSESADAWLWKSKVSFEMCDMDMAQEFIDKAIVAAPESSLYYFEKGLLLEFEEHPDTTEILVNYKMSMQMNEYDYSPFMYAGKIYMAQGETVEAERCFDKVVELMSKEENDEIDFITFVDFYRGEYDKVRETIEAKLKLNEMKNCYNAACLYCLLGEKELALMYLEKYLENGAKNFHYIEMDHDFDGIENDPEFKALIEKYRNK